MEQNHIGNNSNYATNIIGVTGIEARKQNGTTGFFGKDLHGDVRHAFNLKHRKDVREHPWHLFLPSCCALYRHFYHKDNYKMTVLE